MVKKSSKQGIHSGNSLRAPNSKHIRVYGKQSCLVRQIENNGPPNFNAIDDENHPPLKQSHPLSMEYALSDWDVTANNVVFSLNKKARWLLPNLIKNQILSEENQEKDFKISLFEHQKIIKKANCISYHTTKGNQKVIHARRGFFDQSGVNTKPGQSRKNRRRQRAARRNFTSGIPDIPTSPPEPEISYDIFYPCSKTSSITYDNKFTGWSYYKKTDGRMCKSSNQRLHHTTSHYLDIFDDETQEGFTEEDLENEDSQQVEEIEEEYKPPDTRADLEYLLRCALKAKDISDVESTYVIPQLDADCQNSFNRNKQHNTKDNVIYLNEELPPEFYPRRQKDKGKESKVDQVSEEFSADLLPTACVIIPSEDLTPENINTKFRGRYFESSCYPRKIGIDMTSEMSEFYREKGYLFGKLEPWTWLTLSVEGIYQEGQEVVRIQLSSEVRFNQLSLDTLFEMNVYSLSEVFQSVRMFIESVSADKISDLPDLICATTSKPKLTFNTLSLLNDWSCDSYHSSESHIISMATANFPKETIEKPKAERPDYCNICFTSIDPSIHDNDRATSLTSCGHWFCDNCWSEHLLCRINQGYLTLHCPEFNCDAQVDHTTSLSLICARTLKKFLQRCHDNKIQQESELKKWCPNPRCGRVVTLTKGLGEEDAGMCVTCECGTSFCFKCLGEAHWPASCEQAKDYKDKIRKYGDERVIDFLSLDTVCVIAVKNCPKCKEPIQKNGGCPHMQCRCGHSFCWACGTQWPHQRDCLKAGQSDKFGTHQVAIRHEDSIKRRPKLYQISLKHRQYRHPKKLRELEKKGHKLAAWIKPWCIRHFAEVDCILNRFGAEGNDQLSINQSVNRFIHSLSALLVEVHFVIEHTSVILHSGSSSPYSRLLYQLIHRMEFVTTRIEMTYEDFSYRNVKTLLPDLFRLQKNIHHCLVTLIRAVTELNYR